MKYEELNALHIARERKKNDWLNSLYSAACALRFTIHDKLGAPEAWDNKGTETAYIRVMKVGRDLVPTPMQHSLMVANMDGIFVFGISITFEPGPLSYPKDNQFTAVGVKMTSGAPTYCIWDLENDAPWSMGQWAATTDEAADMVIKYFSEALTSFDPETSFISQQKLGFY